MHAGCTALQPGMYWESESWCVTWYVWLVSWLTGAVEISCPTLWMRPVVLRMYMCSAALNRCHMGTVPLSNSDHSGPIHSFNSDHSELHSVKATSQGLVPHSVNIDIISCMTSRRLTSSMHDQKHCQWCGAAPQCATTLLARVHPDVAAVLVNDIPGPCS